MLIQISSLNAQQSLTLDEAFEIALQNNYGIQIAQTNLEISSVENHPGNAGLLPAIYLQSGVDYSSNNSKQTFFDGSDREANWAGNFNFNTAVQADWTIYDGGAGKNRKSILQEMENFSAQEIEVRSRALFGELAQTFYTLIYYRDSRNLINESIQFFEDLKQLEEERLNMGSGTRLNVLQTETELNREMARLEQVRSWEQIAMQDLRRIMNAEMEEINPVGENYFEGVEVDQEAILAEVSNKNPELILESINQSIRERELEVSRSERYPTLELNAGISYNKSLSDVGILQSNRNFGPYAGATLRFNIFDGHRNKRQIEANQLRLKMGVDQMTDLRRELETEVVKRHLAFVNAGKLLDIEKENLELNLQNLEIAEEMFEAGRINNFELREIQQQLVRAEEAVVNMRRERALAYIDLLVLVGG